MNGTVSSASCHIVLLLSATTTHLEVYFAKAVNYTLMITSVSFIQVFLQFLGIHVLTCSAAVTYYHSYSWMACLRCEVLLWVVAT